MENNDQNSSQSFEDKVDRKVDDFSQNIEGKWKEFEKKIPKPVMAVGDVVCGGVILMGLAWIAERFNWIESYPSWNVWVIILGVGLILALVYRYVIKKSK